MRLLFALPGFHRTQRGAEVALLAVAEHLARLGDEVTVAGSGPAYDGASYRYERLPVVSRERLERLPHIPAFRTDGAWEEATFVPGLLRWYRPSRYDATVTCGYPFMNWALRRGRDGPAHLFVTQNGDWPARSNEAEYRLFDCDGLVCTNPEYFDANNGQWRAALIPNGVDVTTFVPGSGDRQRFGLPEHVPIVLMVSALIESKRVREAVSAVAELEDAWLVVAGDGALRDQLDEVAARLLPGRFLRLSVASTDMPELYRCADVFLHMTLLESFGNVYVEALACGLPIVAHRSAVLEWILGDQGLLVDTEVREQVVEGLRRALTAPIDDVTRQARHEMARARFDWPRVAEQYRSFARTVVDAKRDERD